MLVKTNQPTNRSMKRHILLFARHLLLLLLILFSRTRVSRLKRERLWVRRWCFIRHSHSFCLLQWCQDMFSFPVLHVFCPSSVNCLSTRCKENKSEKGTEMATSGQTEILFPFQQVREHTQTSRERETWLNCLSLSSLCVAGRSITKGKTEWFFV